MAKECCRMPHTAFTHRVELQRNAGEGTYDSYGQITDNWTRDADLYCHIATLGGREAELARQVYASATYKLVTRYRAGITTKKRIKFGSRILNIGHVDDIDPRADVTMLCAEDAPT